MVAFVLVVVVAFFMMTGLFTVAPNLGVVLQLFGAYRGTTRDEGLRWANPLYLKKKVSLRIRNFTTETSKEALDLLRARDASVDLVNTAARPPARRSTAKSIAWSTAATSTPWEANRSPPSTW